MTADEFTKFCLAIRPLITAAAICLAAISLILIAKWGGSYLGLQKETGRTGGSGWPVER